MSKMLYSSAEIRKAIIRLFSSGKGRRVAISAFVGEGAEAYLPRPKGIELICWPKEGGTNPHVLRRLAKKGVDIWFCDSLHMKVYWAENEGAVVTSANLSSNALGAGDLKEVGVLLPPGNIAIDVILDSLTLRKMSHRELVRLDRLHNLYHARNRIRVASKVPPFREWFSLPCRPQWKLAWWEKEAKGTSAETKLIAKTEYDIAEPHDSIFDERRDYHDGDWILVVKVNKQSATYPHWLFVERIIHVPKSDKVFDPETPYELIQLWSLKNYPPRPFRIDKLFRRALSHSMIRLGIDKLKRMKSAIPPDRLINMIYKRIKK